MIGRRTFLHSAAAVGMTGLLRVPTAQAEPPPETTKITMVRLKGICLSPQYVAADLLRAEGFTEVRYVEAQGTEGIEKALASGEADLNGHYAAPLILRLEAAIQSSSWPASTPVASSCSAPFASARSATSRARQSPCLRSIPAGISSCR